MKKTAILLFCFFSIIVRGQSGFTLNLSIPVNENGNMELAWAGGLNFPVFSEIDLSNDNILDLFVFDRSNNRVLTFINNGSAGIHCWEYAPQFEDPFPVMKGWASLYDYNQDNKPDLFCTNNHNNGITQYRNDSQNGNVVFTLVDSTIKFNFGNPSNLSNIIANALLMPNFNDIDGDGDMDIIGKQFNCLGSFAYYKNMSMEDYGTADSLNDYVLETNAWGEFTLGTTSSNNVSIVNYNVNCFQGPGHTSDESARSRKDFDNIFTIDIDGDGDKDALIGGSHTFNSLLAVNGGNANHAIMVKLDSLTMLQEDTLFPSYDVSVNINSFAAHAYVDADNDGIKDLIISQSEYENKKGVYFYKNAGTNAVPHFNQVIRNFLQNEMIDVGESATPVFFDYNSDGLKDLVIGNKRLTTTDTSYQTGLTLYKNIGTSSAPSFELVTDDYANLHSLQLDGQIFPTFGDIDGDGDNDMILGEDEGKLILFENTAGPGVPAVFGNSQFYYSAIDVGLASTPQLIDLNRDGLLDLVIGGKNGMVKYFENTGTVSSPVFSNVATKDTLGGINVETMQSSDGYAVPYVFEQAGVYRMLVSCMNGEIYLYGNIDGNLTGNFTVLDTVLTKTGGNRYGYNLSVSGCDLNDDSLVDMVVGYYGGGLQIFYQSSPNSISIVNEADLLRIQPNPASEILVVKSLLQSRNAKYSLIDITGRVILSQSMHGGYAIIDVSKIAAGSYLLRFNSGKTSITKKVIISH